MTKLHDEACGASPQRREAYNTQEDQPARSDRAEPHGEAARVPPTEAERVECGD